MLCGNVGDVLGELVACTIAVAVIYDELLCPVASGDITGVWGRRIGPGPSKEGELGAEATELGESARGGPGASRNE